MSEEVYLKKEVTDLRERVVRLDVKIEELNKRLDSFRKVHERPLRGLA